MGVWVGGRFFFWGAVGLIFGLSLGF
jgi:hypothetical protein